LAISRKRKEELVAQYAELLEKSDALFIADYTGMSVQSLEALRAKVREADGALYVTKNTLLGLVLEEAGRPVPDALLTGQVATGFALGEAPVLAKALKEFAKKSDHLQIRGGVFGSTVLSADQVEALADMPSLDQLRAQLIGVISAPARNVASVVAGGVRQVVNVLDAYVKKEEEVAAA
jgi:large subunit ribosomal protein L10